MRDIRVFTDQPLTPDTEIVLEDNIAHHLTVVLRLKAGTGIVLFNGTGGEYHAILGQVTGKLPFLPHAVRFASRGTGLTKKSGTGER